MTLERLWAGWRHSYVAALDDERRDRSDRDEGTLFERILRARGDDAANGIVHRGSLASVVLNAYPYGSGHVLVVPNRPCERLADLTRAESHELWATVETAVDVIEREYRCPGVNVGLNQGRAAGAGVPDHLHVHVLPRWAGDTNFMTSIAETRVLPEPLEVTVARLRTAWAASARA